MKPLFMAQGWTMNKGFSIMLRCRMAVGRIWLAWDTLLQGMRVGRYQYCLSVWCLVYGLWDNGAVSVVLVMRMLAMRMLGIGE